MRLTNKKLLRKYLEKNKGNKYLKLAAIKLVEDLELNNFRTREELLNIRPDADKVHPIGFYFFDLKKHRTMILVEFEEGEAMIIWCGDHDQYESIFKNNKDTIKKWLKSKNWIK